MPIYKVDTTWMTYGVAYVHADNEEEAIELARGGEWDSMDEEDSDKANAVADLESLDLEAP